MAAKPATTAGCCCGRLSTPVQSCTRSVNGIALAMNMSGEVTGSVMELKCSPIQTSSKPRRSASSTASRSSSSTSW